MSFIKSCMALTNFGSMMPSLSVEGAVYLVRCRWEVYVAYSPALLTKKHPILQSMGKWGKYKKKYNSKWEDQPGIRDWIGRVPNDDTKVMCRYCKCRLRAHNHDLHRHAQTSKHRSFAGPKASAPLELPDSGPSAFNSMSSYDVPHVLHPTAVEKAVKRWLLEDTPGFDHAGFVVGDLEETAVIMCKSPGVLAGVPFVDAVFHELDCWVQWKFREGAELYDIPCEVATVTGRARRILLGERLALNILARASGVAKKARRFTQIAQSHNWHGEIAGTRKTTPGFRMVEKYALLIGGVSTHRYDLSSMIMLKDNHIWSAGSITKAVHDARRVGGFSSKIEVECRSVPEATEAALAGAEIVMLDNFEPQAAREAAGNLKDLFPQLIIEVSGGITEENVSQLFSPYINVLSSSTLVQGYSVVDYSLKIVKPGHDPRNPTVTTPRTSMPVDPTMPSQALINSMMLTTADTGDGGASARDVEPQGLVQGEQGEELETTTVIITTTDDNVSIMESTGHSQS
ncbi:nicotinate-nucleotide pyrophosphorylase [carboxylating]-like [Acanthaster planci]|uniref:Nicotinate-nucleotide pyrophosphorylase [carboxylating] n=1 Tax=Acanthaster planci TaxID=133434 RepID=A0A8B7ZZ36_ACAPL|nr:nicotinate-nucleotide pyrophosphorylase [carboxylating]-like [Acanthaster planci]